MAKYSNINRISKQDQDDLFLLLAESLVGMKKTDAAKVLRDLLSQQESVMLARRLKIALLLEKGFSYQQIRKEIPVSDSTIAKIQLWLKTYGDGFRLALPKIDHEPDDRHILEEDKLGWRSLKKRYPAYFWPELVLKQIVKSANKRERQRLSEIVEELRDKTPLTKQLQKILRQNSYTT